MRGAEGKVDLIYLGLLGTISTIAGCSQQPPYVSAAPPPKKHTHKKKRTNPFIPYKDKGGSQPGCLHKSVYSISVRWTAPTLRSIISDRQVIRSWPAAGWGGSPTDSIFPTVACQNCFLGLARHSPFSVLMLQAFSHRFFSPQRWKLGLQMLRV